MSILRKFRAAAFILLTAVLSATTAKAQYYEIANQVPQLISPALSGSFNYRGFVEASFAGGIGTNAVNSLEFSTTQGFKYADWFFMGVGAGVNILFSNYDDSGALYYSPSKAYHSRFDTDNDYTDTGVLIPLYSDFRFNIGSEQNVNFFIDMRIGASFLISDDYLRTSDGVINNDEGFYFRPAIGLRIPTNKKDYRQAINIGVCYQLITNNYWNNHWDYDSSTLNAIGASVSFEW